VIIVLCTFCTYVPLHKTYKRLDNPAMVELLKLMASIPMDIEGDAFGKIYEYFLGNIARLYRGEEPENLHGSADMMAEYGFLPSTSERGAGGEGMRYVDVPGLCKVATIQEIEKQGWSLNPGRYVGVADRKEDDFDFKERLEQLNEELETLNAEARELEERIAGNVVKLLEQKA
jgi:type I restriction-modification system DNA methylase subunit